MFIDKAHVVYVQQTISFLLNGRFRNGGSEERCDTDFPCWSSYSDGHTLQEEVFLSMPRYVMYQTTMLCLVVANVLVSSPKLQGRITN